MNKLYCLVTIIAMYYSSYGAQQQEGVIDIVVDGQQQR
jgi:hypothetical protein